MEREAFEHPVKHTMVLETLHLVPAYLFQCEHVVLATS